MPQTIRITITPDLDEALQTLRLSTMGTLNTTQLIKLAVGSFARIKKADMSAKELDRLSAGLFYEWAKEDETIDQDVIAQPEKLKPFTPKPYVRTR